MSAKSYAGAYAWPNGDKLTIDRYLRVTNNAGNLALAGDGADDYGLLAARIDEQNEVGSVEPLVPNCVYQCVAADAVTAGGTVNQAADGKIATAGTNQFGVALDSATGDGSVIRVRYKP